MSESEQSRTEKNFWNNPRVDRADGQIVGVDFRDGYIRIEDGKVTAFLEKERGLLLVPNDVDADGRVSEWCIVDKENEPTGQFWSGTIEFSNNSVIIEQMHNGLKRTYIADGAVETEYRTSRVTEMPGRRRTVYKDGTRIEENVNDKTSVITYDDRVVTRQADGSSEIRFTDDSEVVVLTDSEGHIFEVRDRNGLRTLVWKGDRICEIQYA
jgi:hypothetical protein